MGRNTAAAIAGALDQTQPQGATPTGPTLQALAQQFNNANFDPDRPPQPKYVLLVTDGEPTCPNTFGGGPRGGRGRDTLAEDRAVTVQAIDQLRGAGGKTYVVGYDAQLDRNFQAALNEFAQHGGTEFYRPVQDEQSLVAELRSIATELVECSYNLDEVPSDPRYVKVVIDGLQVNLGDLDAGWTIDGTTVTIHGKACEGLQDGQTHLVNVTVECEVVPVR